jgi:hypothetical protein
MKKKARTTKFVALDVVVLRLHRKPDRSNEIFPPECYCTLPDKVPVSYSGDDKQIGWATVKRVDNVLMADIWVYSLMSPPEDALDLMRQLVPSVNGVIKDAYENVITHFEVTSLTLGDGNADKAILPLGEKIYFAHGAKDLH